MKRRTVIILFAIMPMTCSFSLPIKAVGTNPRGLRTTRIMDCLTSVEISDALRELSADYAEGQEAGKVLLGAAARSPKCRLQIITSLMTALAAHVDITHDQESNYLWREGSELLGELKATEALDLLISHLALTDGEFSSSMTHQPALAGLIKIGSSAVPRLEAVLAKNSEPTMRWSAIYCLSQIGGRNALKALTHAQQHESDPCLSSFMRASVESLSNRQYKFKLTEEWVQGSLCS